MYPKKTKSSSTTLLTVRYTSIVVRTVPADFISRCDSKNFFAFDNLPKASKNSRCVSAFSPPIIISFTYGTIENFNDLSLLLKRQYTAILRQRF